MELRATAFFSRIMPAVVTDSAIGRLFTFRLNPQRVGYHSHSAADESLSECGTFFVSIYLLRFRAVLPLEEHHYMSRSTFLVVALSCALSYAAYGQQPS